MFNREMAGGALCGWSGHRAAEGSHDTLLASMAEPLVRFDRRPVESCVGPAFGIAVTGNGGFHREEGLAVAICGSPAFRDAQWRQGPEQSGIAAAVARRWKAVGRHVCDSLAGEFSLCIVDEAAGEILLAVDRMGSRPVYYQVANAALLFGSSAASLVRHPLGTQEVDPQSLYNYVYFHMIPGPASIHRGQQRLLPGECLHFRRGAATVHRYWKMHFEEERRPPFGELKQQFLGLVEDSVRAAAGSARTGAFLSGGTDSSTIAGFLGRATGKPADTYSIGFEAEGYDEMEYARIAARHFGTRHHEYYVTPDDVAEAIPHIAEVFDQPFGNASAVPAYFCARMAREDGIERLLGGDGGDELFGGNERYARQRVFSLYERIPTPLRASILEPIAFHMPGGGQIALVRKARSYIEQATVPMPARLETYNLLGRYGHATVFTADFLRAVDPDNPLDCLNETYRQTNAATLINRMLALDFKITLADNDLPKVVKACELAGVDVSFPFLSDDMIDFSARLAPEMKLKGTRLRYFFKEALRGFLPDEIITKKKHGFGLPFGVWLQKHKRLQDLARGSLSDLKRRGIVRPEFIDGLEQHLKEHAGYHGTMIWVLMMLEQWFKRHGGRI